MNIEKQLKEFIYKNAWPHDTSLVSIEKVEAFADSLEGMVLAPKEPTEKMIMSAQAYVHSYDIELIYRKLIEAAKE